MLSNGQRTYFHITYGAEGLNVTAKSVAKSAGRVVSLLLNVNSVVIYHLKCSLNLRILWYDR